MNEGPGGLDGVWASWKELKYSSKGSTCVLSKERAQHSVGQEKLGRKGGGLEKICMIWRKCKMLKKINTIIAACDDKLKMHMWGNEQCCASTNCTQYRFCGTLCNSAYFQV